MSFSRILDWCPLSRGIFFQIWMHNCSWNSQLPSDRLHPILLNHTRWLIVDHHVQNSMLFLTLPRIHSQSHFDMKKTNINIVPSPDLRIHILLLLLMRMILICESSPITIYLPTRNEHQSSSIREKVLFCNPRFSLLKLSFRDSAEETRGNS